MAGFILNDPVAKGAVTRCLDEISNRDDARARLDGLRNAIRALENAQFRGLEAVFAEYLLRDFYDSGQSERITEYLKRFWFDEVTGWWPAFQPIAPIYALGLLQALNLALAVQGPRSLPLESYWIMGHQHVELIALASPRQVTLLIATPFPPERAPTGIASETSEVWVTGRRAGVSQQEVDPTTGREVRRESDLRVRTFRIQTRGTTQA